MIVISHTCRGIYKNIAQLLVTVKHVSITLLTKLTLQIPLKEKIVGEGFLYEAPYGLNIEDNV